ncbi:glycoside hydrolase family 16 protein [Rhizobium halophytocola]|nr:glycoside hydrolase family 16 protein [Rhizobium halophytocola]
MFAVSIGGSPAFAQQGATGKSFVDNFDTLDKSFWYISDGWNNGDHQNCTWSKGEVHQADGSLELGFEKKKLGARDYACGEIQTKARFGYGTYEIRMQAATGSGLNSAFFSYIGETDNKPHDEIDFEVLGKNTDEVQLNQYVSGTGGNEKLVAVAGGADKSYHDYAFIWAADRIRYFIDGKLVHEVTDTSKIPSNAQKIFMSLWGTDTLSSWMGPFAYEAPISMKIDRVAFTAPGEDCQFPDSVLCTLD